MASRYKNKSDAVACAGANAVLAGNNISADAIDRTVDRLTNLMSSNLMVQFERPGDLMTELGIDMFGAACDESSTYSTACNARVNDAAIQVHHKACQDALDCVSTYGDGCMVRPYPEAMEYVDKLFYGSGVGSTRPFVSTGVEADEERAVWSVQHATEPKYMVSFDATTEHIPRVMHPSNDYHILPIRDLAGHMQKNHQLTTAHVVSIYEAMHTQMSTLDDNNHFYECIKSAFQFDFFSSVNDPFVDGLHAALQSPNEHKDIVRKIVISDAFFSLRASICGGILMGVAATAYDMHAMSGETFCDTQHDYAQTIQLFDYTGNDTIIDRYKVQNPQLDAGDGKLTDTGLAGDAARLSHMGTTVASYLKDARKNIKKRHAAQDKQSYSARDGTRSLRVDVTQMKRGRGSAFAHPDPDEAYAIAGVIARDKLTRETVEKRKQYANDITGQVSRTAIENTSSAIAVYWSMIGIITAPVLSFMKLTALTGINGSPLAPPSKISPSTNGLRYCDLCAEQCIGDAYVGRCSVRSDSIDATTARPFWFICDSKCVAIVHCCACSLKMSAFRRVCRAEKSFSAQCKKTLQVECGENVTGEHIEIVFSDAIRDAVRNYVRDIDVVTAAWGAYIVQPKHIHQRRLVRMLIGDRMGYDPRFLTKHHSLQCHYYFLNNVSLRRIEDLCTERCWCYGEGLETNEWALCGGDGGDTERVIHGIPMRSVVKKFERDLEKLYHANDSGVDSLSVPVLCKTLGLSGWHVISACGAHSGGVCGTVKQLVDVSSLTVYDKMLHVLQGDNPPAYDHGDNATDVRYSDNDDDDDGVNDDDDDDDQTTGNVAMMVDCVQ